MVRTAPEPLPEFSPDRLLDRMSEALQVAAEPARFKTFPGWTQRVMGIFKEQFVPREFAALLAGDASVFAEGIAVAWAAKARDLAQTRSGTGGVLRKVWPSGSRWTMGRERLRCRWRRGLSRHRTRFKNR